MRSKASVRSPAGRDEAQSTGIGQSETDAVAYTVGAGIAWVSFNRPEKRNCMNPTLNRQMGRVLDELEHRADVGVLVLTGEGTAWSAGMDLKEYFRETEAQGLGAVRRAQREAYTWWRRLRWYQKPAIAMVNGWCFGGAYGPLFACDLAFAAEEARFGLSEINWGILPGGGVTGACDCTAIRHSCIPVPLPVDAALVSTADLGQARFR